MTPCWSFKKWLLAGRSRNDSLLVVQEMTPCWSFKKRLLAGRSRNDSLPVVQETTPCRSFKKWLLAGRSRNDSLPVVQEMTPCRSFKKWLLAGRSKWAEALTPDSRSISHDAGAEGQSVDCSSAVVTRNGFDCVYEMEPKNLAIGLKKKKRIASVASPEIKNRLFFFVEKNSRHQLQDVCND